HSTQFITFHQSRAPYRWKSAPPGPKFKTKPNFRALPQDPHRAQFTPAPIPEIKAHKMIRSEVRMSPSWLVIAAALTGSASAFAAPKAIATPGDPKLVSMHPFTGERGAASIVTVRGTGLREATTVFLENAPFTATIEGSEPTPADKTGKAPQDAIRLRIQ